MAESFDDRYMEGTAGENSEVSRAFDALRALGEASNAGAGDDEALRQACALLQDQGAAALQATLTSQLRNPSLLSKYSGSRIGSAIYAQGQGALGSALSSACASLTGDGTGGMGSLFDADRLMDMGLALALDEGLGALKSTGLPFATNLEINGSLFGSGGTSWEVITVQPLWHDADKLNHLFTQISWNRTIERAGYADGDTLNAGLAWRRLTDDRTMVYGLNAFFDHALEMNHNRMSVGADLQTSQIGLSANKYFPLSDWKSVDAYKEERASSGFDLELQGRLPQFPAWQMNLKGYQWSSNTDMEQETTYGYDASLQWQPVNALIWEAGIRDEQDSEAELHTALRLVYRVGDSIEEMWKAPTPLPTMEDRVYDKVRRDNAMRVEQRIKDSAYVTVTQTAGANNAALADGTTKSLSTGLQLPRPMTVTVSAAGGSIARLTFRDGAVLTIGAGSQVRIEATLITLLSGSLHYVSGTQNVMLAAPGATVTLLGTDIDLSTDGTNSTLRVRDGRAQIAGTSSGAATLNPEEAASSVSGVVGASLATNDPAFIAHTDTISEDIDRVASPLVGAKVAPYATEPPRLTATSTTSGQPITIALKFNDAVTVAGGAPRLVLNINGNARYAMLSGGSGTNDLVFTYTLQPTDGGAATATVQSLDPNGATITGNGKDAVTTIADTVLDLGGSVGDVIAPSGYAVAFTTGPVTISNQTAIGFQITGAEIGATFDYTISSNNGGTDVTGSGTIATATQNVTGLDLTGVADGTLTLSLTLTDAETNTGAAAADTVNKTVIALSLDFVNGAYALNGTSYSSFTAIPGATFTRASPATTYAEDSAGNLVAFAANTPRITDKGILIEGSRTNLALYSNDFNQAGWSRFNVTAIQNSALAPDGSMTAYKIVEGTTASTQHWVARTGLSVVSGQKYTISIFAKSAERAVFNMFGSAIFSQAATFNLSSGTITLATAPATITPLSNGWYRCTLTLTAGSTGAALAYVAQLFNPGTTYTGDGTSGLYIWGAQVEQGDFPSSYIPTAAAAVARNADVANVTLPTALSPPYSLYALFSFSNGNSSLIPSNRAAISFTDGTNSQRSILYNAGGGTGMYNIDTAASYAGETASAGGIVEHDTYVNLASSISGTRQIAARDGNLSMQKAGTMAAALNHVGIGNNNGGTSFLYGYLKNIAIYPSAYTDSQLQSLTAP